RTAALARPWHFESEPLIPPRLPFQLVLVTNTRLGLVQLPLQPSLPTTLPSSHCSFPLHRCPSPHFAALQLLRHASPLLPLPSSHSSLLLTCLNPSPHFAKVHASVQVPVLLLLAPRSHCSAACLIPS